LSILLVRSRYLLTKHVLSPLRGNCFVRALISARKPNFFFCRIYPPPPPPKPSENPSSTSHVLFTLNNIPLSQPES
jgi:hypothetical protein